MGVKEERRSEMMVNGMSERELDRRLEGRVLNWIGLE